MQGVMNINLGYILSAFSILISSGAIGYAVRLVIRLEVLEHRYDDNKEEMGELSDKQIETASDILRLKDSMARIDVALDKVVRSAEALPTINERLGTILVKVGEFVPRPEIDSKLERIKDGISDNQQRIKTLDSKLELTRRNVPAQIDF